MRLDKSLRGKLMGLRHGIHTAKYCVWSAYRCFCARGRRSLVPRAVIQIVQLTLVKDAIDVCC